MKKIGRIIECMAVVAILCCTVACSKNKDMSISGASYPENYIRSYLIPDKINMVFRFEKGEMDFFLDGDFSIRLGSDEYNALAEKYNDLSYNRAQVIPIEALYDGITSLSIETVDYFDEAHPAGSDVSDIVVCKYQTFYEYISSGYVSIERNWYYPYLDDCGNGSTVHEMGLSEVNYDNSQIMYPEIIIWFISEPDEPGTYEFKFHLKMPEVEINTTFEYEFQ